MSNNVWSKYWGLIDRITNKEVGNKNHETPITIVSNDVKRKTWNLVHKKTWDIDDLFLLVQEWMQYWAATEQGEKIALLYKHWSRFWISKNEIDKARKLKIVH